MEGLFAFRAKLPLVYHTRWMLHRVSFSAERQAGKL